jgi:type I restriction enzyme M protein
MAKTKSKTKEVQQEPIEKVLWATANKLRKNIDAAEYKHVVLGLIFLRYISDAFAETVLKQAEMMAEMIY